MKGIRKNLFLPWENRRQREQTAMLRRPHVWGTVLAAVVIAAALLWRHDTAVQRRQHTYHAIDRMKAGVQRFRASVGRCPRSKVELLQPPHPRTPKMRTVPKDGWNRDLRFRCPAPNDPTAVWVTSAGPSGSFDLDDNIQ